MPSYDSNFSAIKQLINKTFRSLFKFRLHRKLISFALILNILIWPGHTFALQQVSVLGATVKSSVSSLATTPLRISTTILEWMFGNTPSVNLGESLADRIAHVATLTLSHKKFVGYQGQIVFFSALPTNWSGQTIQGVKLTWESSNADKVQVDDSGRALLLEPGLARVTCRAGAISATTPVLVRPGQRPLQSDAEWKADQSSLNLDGIPVGQAPPNPKGILSWLLEKLAPTAYAQSGGYSNQDFPYDELWSEPRNLVGSPNFRTSEATAIGSVMPEGSNFRMAMPIISLGGRGLAANLNLYYNSRVWSRHGSAVTFDAIESRPSPGFSLGFGRLVTYGPTSATKYLWIDPDGTRHYLGQGGTPTQNVTLQTTDGTHITYSGNATYGGTLYYQDGTKVDIYVTANRLLPGRITDSNGNYILIAQKFLTCDPECLPCEECPPGYFPLPLTIDYVTDTVGRVIQFNYDSNINLTSITAPGFGGTSQNPVTRTLVRLDYQSRAISGNFSGLTVENKPVSANLIRHIYFPATTTGYLFSYSDFGMAYNVSMRRQMTVNQSGVISDGVECANVSFNYPQLSTPALNDAPAFTQRTETESHTPTGTYTYSRSSDTVAQTMTFTVTRPDSSQLLLTRSTDPTSKGFGLLTKSDVRSGSASFAKGEYVYKNVGGPAIESVTSYDDTGTPVKVSFNYDVYGNVNDKREYGNQVSGNWVVRRRTTYSYQTGTPYISAYLRSLVTEVMTYDAQQNDNDADDVMIARTSFAYDNYSAMGGMENYEGIANPPGHLASYDTTVTVRGNVTETIRWTDIAQNLYISRLKKYDIFGNLVKEQAACCSEKSYTCPESYCWAMPDHVTSGPSGSSLTEAALFDFNTNKTKTATDPRSKTTTYGYDAALRNTSVIAPTGATHSNSFDESSLTSGRSVSYDDDGTAKYVFNSAMQDGWGRPIQSVNANGGQVNMTYDAMGRMLSQTNPFAQGGQPGPSTTYQYDALGRQTLVTLPDGNMVRTEYSGSTVTITDPVNCKIKRETDGLGRLVKVTEQDAAGNLTQNTTYTYDLLNNLIGVNQGNQTRSYKYDALGRLLYERIPEQAATIDDGTGMWSCSYTYTNFNAVATKTDARGVVTTYSYDSLNRLTSISYSSAAGVAATSTVTYTYDTNSASATYGLPLSVTVGSVYQESYTYDTSNRLLTNAHRIDTRTYTTNFQLNQVGQAKQIAHQNFSYDDKGRLAEVKSGPMLQLYGNTTYNVAGQLTGDRLVSTNLIDESFVYDSQRLQLTSQIATRNSDGASLMNLTYGYQATAGQMGAGSTAGNSGQLMNVSGTINGTAESASYTYDLLNRLATSNQTSNGVNAQRRYAYDRWGNRTGVWNAVSGGSQIQSITLQQSGGAPSNRIASVSNQSTTLNYTYDSAGNVTNDGVHSYTYDAENRLVSVDGGATASYSYDHQNRRVKKVVGQTTTYYVWEGGQVIAEYDGINGAALISYYYAGSRMIASINHAAGSQRYFYLSDRLSKRLTLDNYMSVVGRQSHLPYGEDFAESGAQEKHHFTSYERDSESGTDYAVNRQYNQSTGRFNRVDPFEGSYQYYRPQSLNRYSYVHNNPINAVDPNGLNLAVDCTMHVGGDGDGLYFYRVCRFYNEPGGGGGGAAAGGGGQVPTADQCKQALQYLDDGDFGRSIQQALLSNDPLFPHPPARDNDRQSALIDTVLARAHELAGNPEEALNDPRAIHRQFKRWGRQYGQNLSLQPDDVQDLFFAIEDSLKTLDDTLEAAHALQNACAGVLQGDDQIRMDKFVQLAEVRLFTMSGFLTGVRAGLTETET